MTIEIQDIKNPKWANAEHTLIDVEVKFSHLPEEYVWFTASPDDTTSYGPEIYQQALAGIFGLIQPHS